MNVSKSINAPNKFQQNNHIYFGNTDFIDAVYANVV